MSVVLDASAILALIAQEPGSDRVAGALDDALLSTVNLAELVGKLRQRGASESDTEAILDELHLEVVPFDRHHAFVAGNLVASTRSAGLSLGDRACLALALATGCAAMTADRAWAEVETGVRVDLIR